MRYRIAIRKMKGRWGTWYSINTEISEIHLASDTARLVLNGKGEIKTDKNSNKIITNAIGSELYIPEAPPKNGVLRGRQRAFAEDLAVRAGQRIARLISGKEIELYYERNDRRPPTHIVL